MKKSFFKSLFLVYTIHIEKRKEEVKVKENWFNKSVQETEETFHTSVEKVLTKEQVEDNRQKYG